MFYIEHLQDDNTLAPLTQHDAATGSNSIMLFASVMAAHDYLAAADELGGLDKYWFVYAANHDALSTFAMQALDGRVNLAEIVTADNAAHWLPELRKLHAERAPREATTALLERYASPAPDDHEGLGNLALFIRAMSLDHAEAERAEAQHTAAACIAANDAELSEALGMVAEAADAFTKDVAEVIAEGTKERAKEWAKTTIETFVRVISVNLEADDGHGDLALALTDAEAQALRDLLAAHGKLATGEALLNAREAGPQW